MALFERGHAGGTLRGGLRGSVALAAQSGESILSGGKLGFELRACLLDRCQLRLPRCDQALLLLAFCRKPLQFAFADRDSFADPRHLPVQLAQQMSGGHRLRLGFAFLLFQAIEQGSVLFNFAPQSDREHFLLAQSPLQFFEQTQHVAQLALHRERSLASLLAAGDGHVVEALAALGKEERIRTGEREFARHRGIGHDVAVSQLRQDHFE